MYYYLCVFLLSPSFSTVPAMCKYGFGFVRGPCLLCSHLDFALSRVALQKRFGFWKRQVFSFLGENFVKLFLDRCALHEIYNWSMTLPPMPVDASRRITRPPTTNTTMLTVCQTMRTQISQIRSIHRQRIYT